MSNVPEYPESSNTVEPSDTLPPSAPEEETPSRPPQFEQVDFTDLEQVSQWLTELRSSIEDIYAIGHEATKRPRKRVLSRFESRRQLEEAKRGLDQILAAARRGLDG